MGDFYELFHDDAEVGSNVLGLALTSRDKNAENPIPMAGFPWHQLEENLRLMLRAGYKVTVAEQEEELREGAKLLERIVTRIYTRLVPFTKNHSLARMPLHCFAALWSRTKQ